MKLSASEVIKNLRSEMGLSQEQFAERTNISIRQLSRIENNQADIHVLELANIMNVFDKPMSALSSYILDSKDYQQYSIYLDAIKHRSFWRWEEFYEAMAKLEDGPKKNHPHLALLVAGVKAKQNHIKRNAQGAVRYCAEDLADSLEAISITIKDFDENKVADDMLTAHEVYEINNISSALADIGEYERAINIAQRLLSNKGIYNSGLYIRCQCVMLRIYIRAGMYNEAVVEGFKAISYAIKENHLIFVGSILGDLADCYKAMGEDASLYQVWALRAYHCIEFYGNERDIGIMRQSLNNYYHVAVDYMPD